MICEVITLPDVRSNVAFHNGRPLVQLILPATGGSRLAVSFACTRSSGLVAGEACHRSPIRDPLVRNKVYLLRIACLTSQGGIRPCISRSAAFLDVLVTIFGTGNIPLVPYESSIWGLRKYIISSAARACCGSLISQLTAQGEEATALLNDQSAGM